MAWTQRLPSQTENGAASTSRPYNNTRNVFFRRAPVSGTHQCGCKERLGCGGRWWFLRDTRRHLGALRKRWAYAQLHLHK